MASFELIYEDADDVLEVTFTAFDETFARTLPLNDSIVLYTDTSVRTAWGLTIYSYASLLQVSETHLDNLRGLPDAAARQILAVMQRPPLSAFFKILAAADFRVLVKSPGLKELM